MKKSQFVTLLVGVVGGLLFSVGMCMCLMPEWNAFNAGVVAAAVGAVILLGLAAVCRVRSGKPAGKINRKLVGKIAYGTVSALVLGAGMAMILELEMMLWGVIVGIVGIIMLLCLIPMCVGFRK